MSPADRLKKARTLLLLDHPFWGTLALKMPLVEDSRIPTACTNGVEVRYNPQFISTLSDPELKTLLAHEMTHVANGHCWRRGTRDKAKWNVATDYADNALLKDSGFVMPKGALLDRRYSGSAEDTYSKLPTTANPLPQGGKGKQDPQQGGQAGQGQGSEQPSAGDPGTQGQDSPKNPARQGSQGPADGVAGDLSAEDPGSWGMCEDPPAKADQAELSADWTVAVAQAAMVAKGQGQLPASLARLVEQIVHPKVPWEVVLRDFVEHSAHNDYNWTRPNRRYLSSGVVLPGLISEELPEVVVAIDTSGSIGVQQLNQFASEVSAVLGAYETTIRLVWCDAAVQKVETLTRADLPLKLSPSGGGGTDFRPVFDWVEKEGLTPACLVYLTDMCGVFPPRDPGYPVLWVRTTDCPAPFGEVVDLK